MGDTPFYDRNVLKVEILEKALSHVSFLGWKDPLILESLQDMNQDPSWSWRLFPEGVRDLLEFWSNSLDQEMLKILNKEGTSHLKIREKITLAVKTRLILLESHKDAARQAFYYFSKPQQIPLALRLSAKTVDEIWYWAGDKSTDYNYYTKRLLLGGVYSSTLFYWLKDESPDHQKTWDFLERRINTVLELPKLPQKAQACTKDLAHRLREVVGALRP
ncbi:COQ9 family protein [Candidatus Bealeia paramacronuclearis]|uniref:COQ9 family protein n=1 Tax=Candidatus Bealeia paramacronuclearis TaxID=1921001 RepID=A0ABZ2C4K2_9PROT|nr:COQ9 family protein [Candidatus Bealeia paramacronuclearis]